MGAISTILALVPKRLLFAASGLVAAFLALWVTYHLGASQGRQQGREAALEQSVETLRERKLTDEKVRDMDAADLCAALGGRLSDDGTCR